MALFGTDGVRGVANHELTAELAMRIGQAAGAMLGHGTQVLVARDTRLSGPMLEAALTAGLTSQGVNVLMAGVIPTPALAHLIDGMNASAGIMISASHNPPEYNGIKLLDRGGRKWSAIRENEVEAGVLSPTALPVPSPDRIGAVLHIEEDARTRYLKYLQLLFAGHIRPLKVIADVAHGAAIATAPAIFHQLGLQVTVLNGDPDGLRINQNCGATHPDIIREAVLQHHADIGLSFDGDADRLIAVDELGHVVDGDEILYALAIGMRERGELLQNTVIATVMSNLGLEKALEQQGIRLERTPVGDRWVAEKMREGNFSLGGEQSGHVILSQWAETGDGVLTALALLSEMSRQNRPLSELVKPVERYPQLLHNVQLPHAVQDWQQEIPDLLELVALAQHELGDEGRIVIRPSGTEPLLRIMLEGRDAGQIRHWADRMAAVVNDALQSAKA
ncbi:MAG: phosphoglucosamine mutase [Sulfobacillus benefaciens]|uniref:Phosphoglucosamine mutase n=1 Tax=Sulfobacillus benefaciens TaxID=453960 RepID=A0A2T2XFH7_9FIRM|nr:MAG: phosphoglucosamine mutase [Sulfobacillus benefaciens]